MQLRSPILLLVLSLMMLSAVMAGCEAIRNDGDVRGRVEVLLTDAPVDDFEEVLVTIDRVEILGYDVEGESTLLVLYDEPQQFNLLELQNGLTARLVDADLPPGRYEHLRLVISEEADVLLKDGTRRSIVAVDRAGLKLGFPSFTISGNEDLVRITVDFDAGRSFVFSAEDEDYAFVPVIQIYDLVVNGEAVEIGAEDTPI